jgi:hypothetical protein
MIAAAVALAGPRTVTPIAAGTARVIPGDAAVTVHRGTPVAAADALLRAGDTLLVEHGTATLKTASGSLFARAGSTLAITDGAPRVTKGDVLVQGQSFNIATRAATAEINGVARVRQGLSLELVVYRGGAVLRTVTETFGLQDLRRAIVAGAGGPATVTIAPLVLSATDSWDRTFLGNAIELDAALTARSRGLTSLAVGRANDVVGKVVASTGWTNLTALSDQPVGELVVAAELARAAHLGELAVKDALKLRADGASWGLIALEQGLHALPATFAGIDEAAVQMVSPVVTTPGSLAPTTVPPAAVNTPHITPTKPSNVSQPPVTVPPTPPAEPDNLVNGLVDGLDNLLGGLLGGGK